MSQAFGAGDQWYALFHRHAHRSHQQREHNAVADQGPDSERWRVPADPDGQPQAQRPSRIGVAKQQASAEAIRQQAGERIGQQRRQPLQGERHPGVTGIAGELEDHQRHCEQHCLLRQQGEQQAGTETAQPGGVMHAGFPVPPQACAGVVVHGDRNRAFRHGSANRKR